MVKALIEKFLNRNGPYKLLTAFLNVLMMASFFMGASMVADGEVSAVTDELLALALVAAVGIAGYALLGPLVWNKSDRGPQRTVLSAAGWMAVNIVVLAGLWTVLGLNHVAIEFKDGTGNTTALQAGAYLVFAAVVCLWDVYKPSPREKTPRQWNLSWLDRDKTADGLGPALKGRALRRWQRQAAEAAAGKTPERRPAPQGGDPLEDLYRDGQPAAAE
jgi:hypothetical protein